MINLSCSNCNKPVKGNSELCRGCQRRKHLYGDPNKNGKHIKSSNKDAFPNGMSDLQREVLVGSLLGDGNLELASKYPRLKIDRAIADEKYLLWEYNIFEEFCGENNPTYPVRYDKRYDKWNEQVSFRTRAIPHFLPYYEQWYIDGVRKVPKDLKLTPLIAAIWFADDGSFIREGNHDAIMIKLSTDSFGKEGVEFLSKLLENMFNCSFPFYQKKKDRDLYFIKASTHAALKFYQYIEPVYDFSMERKIDNWKRDDYKNICEKYSDPDIFARGKYIINNDKLYTELLIFGVGNNINITELSSLIGIDKNGSYAVRRVIKNLSEQGYINLVPVSSGSKITRTQITPSGYIFFSSELSKA